MGQYILMWVFFFFFLPYQTLKWVVKTIAASLFCQHQWCGLFNCASLARAVSESLGAPRNLTSERFLLRLAVAEGWPLSSVFIHATSWRSLIFLKDFKRLFPCLPFFLWVVVLGFRAGTLMEGTCILQAIAVFCVVLTVSLTLSTLCTEASLFNISPALPQSSKQPDILC